MSFIDPSGAAAGPDADGEEEITIASPFDDFTAVFDAADAADAYSDVAVVLPDRAAPLRLHRALLARASLALRTALHAPPTAPAHYDPATRTLVGFFAGADAAECAASVAWLRYCYGAPVRVRACAVPAALAALLRLDLAPAGHAHEAQARLEALALAAAAKDVRVGAQLLRDAAGRPACCRDGVCRIDRALARVVLSRAQMTAHPALVVDATLLALPAAYLACAEYGAPGSACSEAAVRLRYVQAHPELVGDARRDALRPADLARLSSAELDALAREWDKDGDGGYEGSNENRESGGVLGLYRDAFNACQARLAELRPRDTAVADSKMAPAETRLRCALPGNNVIQAQTPAPAQSAAQFSFGTQLAPYENGNMGEEPSAKWSMGATTAAPQVTPAPSGSLSALFASAPATAPIQGLLPAIDNTPVKKGHQRGNRKNNHRKASQKAPPTTYISFNTPAPIQSPTPGANLGMFSFNQAPPPSVPAWGSTAPKNIFWS